MALCLLVNLIRKMAKSKYEIHKDNEKEVYKYFKSQQPKYNYSDDAILGIMANIHKETGGSFDWEQPQMNYKTMEPSGPGRGLFQIEMNSKFHGKQFKDFLERNNRQDSMEAQIDYFLESIYDKKSPARASAGGGDMSKLSEMMSGNDANAVTKGMLDLWERPGVVDNYRKFPDDPEYALAYNDEVRQRRGYVDNIRNVANDYNLNLSLDTAESNYNPEVRLSSPPRQGPYGEMSADAVNTMYFYPMWDGLQDVAMKEREEGTKGIGTKEWAIRKKKKKLILNSAVKVLEKNNAHWVIPILNEAAENLSDDEAWAQIEDDVNRGVIRGYPTKKAAKDARDRIFDVFIDDNNRLASLN